MRLAPLGTLQSQAGGGFASNKPPQGGAWHLPRLQLLLAILRFVLVPGTYRAGRKPGFASNPRPPQGGAWHLSKPPLLLAIFRFVLVPGTYGTGRELGFASNPRPRRRCLAPRETTTFASHFPV
jgi:hypothetical protein